jgi:hypothetical protein
VSLINRALAHLQAASDLGSTTNSMLHHVLQSAATKKQAHKHAVKSVRTPRVLTQTEANSAYPRRESWR